MIIPYAKWQPDLAPLNTGALSVLNTLWGVDGYEPIYSPVPAITKLYNDTPLKLFAAYSSTGIAMPICIGRESSVRFTGNNFVTLNNSSFLSDTAAVTSWGDFVYFWNGRKQLQKIDLINQGDFSSVVVPDGMSAVYAAIVGDFHVAADIRFLDGSIRHPYRVHWSGILRPEIFIPEPSIQCDFQDVSDIGRLQGIVGGEYGMILGLNGMARMDYVGPDAIFKISTLEDNVGCKIPNSLIRTGNIVFFYSRRGWRRSDGGPSYAIGDGHIDNWFARSIDLAKINRMSVIVIPTRNIVMWNFVSNFSPDGEPDYVLGYNWMAQAWFVGQFSTSILGESVAASYDTDAEVLPFNTNITDEVSAFTDGWDDNESFFAAIANKQLCKMQQGGMKLDARIETKEIEFNPNGLAMTTKFRPIFHGLSGNATIIGRITARNVQTDESLRMVDSLKPEPSGTFSRRIKARYHRFRFVVNGSFSKALGVYLPDIKMMGFR